MDGVISNIVESPAAASKDFDVEYSPVALLVDTRLGLASLVTISCFVLGVVIEPPFLLQKSEDPVKEPTISYFYAWAMALATGAAVLVFPSVATK